MAIIKHMLGEKVISGFRGVLDFYYWMGIPCVRAWPKSPGHARSAAVEAQWQFFAKAVALWREASPDVREACQWMSSDTGLTSRDIFMRCYMSGYKKTITTVDELE